MTAVSAGYYHSLALKSDGTVWAWGYNNYGQLGDGSQINRAMPVQVANLASANIVAISAGAYYSLALSSNGVVYAWGDNQYNQLGDGTAIRRLTPVPITGLSNVKSISAGYEFSLALTNDGTVWSWGDNSFWQLGDGGITTSRTTPGQVSGLSNMSAVGAGAYHGMALKSDGTVWTWGYNMYGAIGDGGTAPRAAPVQVTSLSSIIAISTNGYHCKALKVDGSVWAWGHNNYGQLGDGSKTNRYAPVQINTFGSIIAVASGYYHSMALGSVNNARMWGFNYYGQVGDGTPFDKMNPVYVDFMP